MSLVCLALLACSRNKHAFEQQRWRDVHGSMGTFFSTKTCAGKINLLRLSFVIGKTQFNQRPIVRMVVPHCDRQLRSVSRIQLLPSRMR